MSSLFHSLVVCGAGITLLQCGGRAQVSGDEPVANGGASGSTGGRGAGAQGGVVAGGGTLSVGGALSTGGSFAVGGSMSVGGTFGVGGSMAVGGSFGDGGSGGTFGSFGGTSAWQQWDCSPDTVRGCSFGQGMQEAFALAQSCPINPSRPRSAKDCAAGQVFSCVLGELNGETGPFNCACLTRTADVPCPCPASNHNCDETYAAACTDFQVQCGCAYTCILK